MNNSELLWKYIDGACTPEEKAEVERLLAEDTAFRLAYAQRLKLHQSLKEQPLEQPSMRFVRNVMDRLPSLYKKLSVRPLFTTTQWSILGALTAVFMLGYSYITYQYAESAPKAAEPSQIDIVASALNGLPTQFMAVLAAVSFGVIGLVWLDRQLKQRFR
ncbi:MAG: hypothetical protein KDC66_15325 [Phaeodactylibacter sp.]|nr:hypothetical protein [Phaeodactylibacter sp.]MCB9275793.1 hypothetical protein [Lewinellaceae bacterium]